MRGGKNKKQSFLLSHYIRKYIDIYIYIYINININIYIYFYIY